MRKEAFAAASASSLCCAKKNRHRSLAFFEAATHFRSAHPAAAKLDLL
jgi:hypothetical protein